MIKPFALLVLAVGLHPQLEEFRTAANTSVVAQDKTSIHVYPTPNRQGSLTVHSAARQPVSFYLFDLEGRLVYQARFAQNERQTVSGLAAGTYTYQAFRDDEELKGGQVEVRN